MNRSIRRASSLMTPLALSLVALSLWAVPIPPAAAQGLYQMPSRWLDDRNQPAQLRALGGSWTVLTMAYGACRRICSTSLRVLQAVQALADQEHVALNFVILGLDPVQDKPADWAAFRTDHKLGRSNWYFLTGDAPAVQQAAQRLGVGYWRYADHIVHDFKIVLVSPEGQVVRAMDAFDQPASMLLP
jgi:cytochrome oxidase Cu insertion factor (SCO1/SenC/PrrC family)